MWMFVFGCVHAFMRHHIKSDITLTTTHSKVHWATRILALHFHSIIVHCVCLVCILSELWSRDCVETFKRKKNRNLKKSNNISALTSDALYWVPETRNKWLYAFCRIRVKIALVDYFKYLACSMFSTLGSSTDYTDGHTCTRMRCERP